MSALRRVLFMAASATWRTYRHPVALMWLLVLPLFFSFVIARFFAGAGDVSRVTVVDEDGGAVAAEFLAGLERTPFRLQRATRAEAEAAVAAGDAEVVVIVPAGFSASVAEGRPRLEILHSPTYQPDERVQRARAVAAALAAGREPTELPLRLEAPRPTADPDTFPFQRTAFGIYAMSALATAMNGAARLHAERGAGTMQRALVMGVPYGEILAAHLLELLMVGIVQGTLISAITGALGLPWLAAGLPGYALALGGTIFAAAGLGAAVAGVARTAAQARNAASLLATALTMLGGGFWPLDIVPPAMEQVGRLSPVYWSMEVVREVFAYGGAAGALVPAAVLLLLGLFGFAVGVTGLRRLAA